MKNSDEHISATIQFRYLKDFLSEHYYKPILMPNKGFGELLKHVIKEDSEREFIKDLVQNRSCLDDMFDWWYFSKIEEVTDEISIPYYNSEEQMFKDFYPDFIFWLKKGNKYYIKFVDPKGMHIGRANAEDKASWFKKVFSNTLDIDGSPAQVSLHFYNDNIGDSATLTEVTTKDFKEIFKP